jgi:hypothetical protein
MKPYFKTTLRHSIRRNPQQDFNKRLCHLRRSLKPLLYLDLSKNVETVTISVKTVTACTNEHTDRNVVSTLPGY